MTAENAKTGAVSGKLEEIYRRYGYLPYKMSRFEEYELYMRNKEFLVSDQVITFTDTNGKLMALKPDVTLSVIRNIDPGPGGVSKVYYSENVYRVSGRSGVFSELMQTGLEAVGSVDDFLVCEVLHLAAESLRAVTDSWVLDVSGPDIISKALDGLTGDPGTRAELLECIAAKNPHGLRAVFREKLPGADPEKAEALTELSGLYGTPGEVLKKAGKLCRTLGASEEYEGFSEILSGYGSDGAGGLRVDFSAVGDMNYYNGIVFRGFAEGIPERVLSGGRYDRLMKKLSRDSGALGFAVYLDTLERLGTGDASAKGPDVDVVLCYEKGVPPETVWSRLGEITRNGKTARAVPEEVFRSPGTTCGEVIMLKNGEAGGEAEK